MKKVFAICFVLALVTIGVATAQDSMKSDNMKSDSMKSDSSMKATHVMGKISDDGKTFTGDKDGKSWSINNPDAVKGHEGHHVVLKAHVDMDKSEVHVMSLKMASDNMKSDSMKNDTMQK